MAERYMTTTKRIPFRRTEKAKKIEVKKGIRKSPTKCVKTKQSETEEKKNAQR